jgi:hypothetical protein
VDTLESVVSPDQGIAILDPYVIDSVERLIINIMINWGLSSIIPEAMLQAG